MNTQIIKKIPLHSKWNVAQKTIPFVVVILIVKYFSHIYGLEFLTLSPLFTALISANIFLIGFLISGTLVDYKESEKLPGDLAASIETIADEGIMILKSKGSIEAKQFLNHIYEFNITLYEWFHKQGGTTLLMKELRAFNDDFLAIESQTQPAFLGRLKQEQNNLRKMIIRIHTISGTDFLGTGYAIAEIITSLIIFGLIFIKMTPIYESLFFVAFVSFILIYMIYFIKDLDNPFGYTDENSLTENVSLKPLEDSQKRLKEYL